MSRKRTHDQMLDAKNEKVDDVKRAINYTGLLQTLQGVDTVVLEMGSQTWAVSRNLLCSASGYFRSTLLGPTVKNFPVQYGSPSGVDLFLQWLYLGSYQEHDGYAPNVTRSIFSVAVEKIQKSSNPKWSIKAAMVAHHFGWCHDVYKFQNYAMARLVQAYNIDEPKAMLTPDMFTVSDHDGKFQAFLEDTLVKDRGDKTVIDHELDWSGIFKRPGFLTRFAKAMVTPLEVRQQQPLVLEKYLVKEK